MRSVCFVQNILLWKFRALKLSPHLKSLLRTGAVPLEASQTLISNLHPSSGAGAKYKRAGELESGHSFVSRQHNMCVLRSTWLYGVGCQLPHFRNE